MAQRAEFATRPLESLGDDAARGKAAGGPGKGQGAECGMALMGVRPQGWTAAQGVGS